MDELIITPSQPLSSIKTIKHRPALPIPPIPGQEVSFMSGFISVLIVVGAILFINYHKSVPGTNYTEKKRYHFLLMETVVFE